MHIDIVAHAPAHTGGDVAGGGGLGLLGVDRVILHGHSPGMTAEAAAAQLVDRRRHGADFDDALINAVAQEAGGCLGDVACGEGGVGDVYAAGSAGYLVVAHSCCLNEVNC